MRWNRLPNTGSFSLSGSSTLRTAGFSLTLGQVTMKTTRATTPSGARNFIRPDRNTRNRVGAGSWLSKSANRPTKTGTMNSSMPMTASTAMTKTTTG